MYLSSDEAMENLAQRITNLNAMVQKHNNDIMEAYHKLRDFKTPAKVVTDANFELLKTINNTFYIINLTNMAS